MSGLQKHELSDKKNSIETLYKRQASIISAIKQLKKFTEKQGRSFNSFEELAQAWSAAQNSEQADQKNKPERKTSGTTGATSYQSMTSTFADTPKEKKDVKQKEKIDPTFSDMQDPITTIREIPALLAEYQEQTLTEFTFIKDERFINTFFVGGFLPSMLRNHIANVMQTQKPDSGVESLIIYSCIDSILVEYNSLFTGNSDLLPDRERKLESKTESSPKSLPSYERPENYLEACNNAVREIKSIQTQLEAEQVTDTQVSVLLENLLSYCRRCNIGILDYLPETVSISCGLTPIDDAIESWQRALHGKLGPTPITRTYLPDQMLPENLQTDEFAELTKKSNWEQLGNILTALIDLKDAIIDVRNCFDKIIESNVDILYHSILKNSLTIENRPDNMIMFALYKKAITANNGDLVFKLLNYMLEIYCHIAQDNLMKNTSSSSLPHLTQISSAGASDNQLAQQIAAIQNIFRYARNLEPTNETAQAIISFIRPPAQFQELSEKLSSMSSGSYSTNSSSSTTTSSNPELIHVSAIQREAQKKESSTQTKQIEVKQSIAEQPQMGQAESEPAISENGRLTPHGIKKLEEELNGENRPGAVRELFKDVDTLVPKDYRSYKISLDSLASHLKDSHRSFKIDLSNEAHFFDLRTLTKPLTELSVSVLNFHNTRLSADRIDWLTSLLPNMHDIIELDLSSKELEVDLCHASEERSMKEFIKMLTQHRTLKNLAILDNRLMIPALRMLINAIPQLKLRVFKISPCLNLSLRNDHSELGLWELIAEKLKENTTIVDMGLPIKASDRWVEGALAKIRPRLKENQVNLLAKVGESKSELSPEKSSSTTIYCETAHNFFSGASSTSSSNSTSSSSSTEQLSTPPDDSMKSSPSSTSSLSVVTSNN